MAIIFDKTNRIMEVESPDTDVIIQQLINAIRDWEDELDNFETAKIADASGKEDLGGGLQVGITLKLFNWKLKFEDRSGPEWVDCSVSGGNLVGVNGAGQPVNPIEPSPYVTVTIVKAVSAALIADAAEWTQAEKDVVLVATPAIKNKTDALPSDPADQSLVEAHVTAKADELKADHETMKEPVADSYDREKDSLKKLSDKVDEILAAPPGGGGVFSV